MGICAKRLLGSSPVDSFCHLSRDTGTGRHGRGLSGALRAELGFATGSLLQTV